MTVAIQTEFLLRSEILSIVTLNEPPVLEKAYKKLMRNEWLKHVVRWSDSPALRMSGERVRAGHLFDGQFSRKNWGGNRRLPAKKKLPGSKYD